MQFQPMQFQPLPIQPFTISTACNFIRSHFQPFAISTYGNFNLRQFQPITLPPNCSQTVLIMKDFMVISKAIKRVQQLTIIFHTMKCDNYSDETLDENNELFCCIDLLLF